MKGFLGVDFNQIGKNKKNPLEKRREILRELDNARTPNDIDRIGKEVRLGWASAKQEYREKFLNPNRSTTEDPAVIEQEIADWENMMRVVKEKSALPNPSPQTNPLTVSRNPLRLLIGKKEEASLAGQSAYSKVSTLGDSDKYTESAAYMPPLEKCPDCGNTMKHVYTDDEGNEYWECDNPKDKKK